MAEGFDLDLDKVTDVLLHDGSWHQTREGSFVIRRPRFSSGSDRDRDLSLSQGAWFSFVDKADGNRVAGPLAAVFGVRTAG